MSLKRPQNLSCTFRPLTPARWRDFVKLFGERGACGGCWCMHWRLRHADFERNKGAGNKRAMKKLVDSRTVPGLIAYHAKEPVGWCSVGPRNDFVRLETSRIFKPVDDQPVWCINCLFIAREYRRKGVSQKLIEAAVKYAARQGASIIEGYPFEPKSGSMPDPFVWTGLVSTYRRAGFVEVARRSPTRPIMRYYTRPE
ncbi:MAG: GNAT family N-acetyltransferase [Candidatus Zixiibacteriota bacterium]|nr:MAG: GNAT family N-acetyltransferase [candidate division Zixibacteria bacterium]